MSEGQPRHGVGRWNLGSTQRAAHLPLWVLQVRYESLAYFKWLVTVRNRFQCFFFFFIFARTSGSLHSESGKDIRDGICPYPSRLLECKAKIKYYFGLNTPPHKTLPYLILCCIYGLEHEWLQVSVTVGKKRRVWAIMVVTEKSKREEKFFSSLVSACSPPSFMVSSSGMISLECKHRPFHDSKILLHTTIFTH